MPTFAIVLLIITIVIIGITVGLYFLGKRAEKKKAEQDEAMAANAMQVSMLIIDKKRLKLKDAGLPAQVMQSTPWYARGAKLPIVKVKAGPQIMNLICEAEIFDDIPVKKEVKATVSGIYITAVKGIHKSGQVVKTEGKKKGIRAWANRTLKEYREKQK